MPLRTCAGCGSTRPQHELVRFGMVLGVLTVGRTVPGRGAYTCGARACFDRAVERRSFSRILRGHVTVPEGAFDPLYTEGDNG